MLDSECRRHAAVMQPGLSANSQPACPSGIARVPYMGNLDGCVACCHSILQCRNALQGYCFTLCCQLPWCDAVSRSARDTQEIHNYYDEISTHIKYKLHEYKGLAAAWQRQQDALGAVGQAQAALSLAHREVCCWPMHVLQGAMTLCFAAAIVPSCHRCYSKQCFLKMQTTCDTTESIKNWERYQASSFCISCDKSRGKGYWHVHVLCRSAVKDRG